MTEMVLFQMWGSFRESLIREHQFYVEQAEARLLSQFDHIEEDADRAANAWLEEKSCQFNPDIHDPADFYERANEEAIEYYQLLKDMENRTILSVAAGMYHEWEKQLRDWMDSEISRWHRGEAVKKRIWAQSLPELIELFQGLDWGVKGCNFYRKLDACRLVVNVYKHGAGPSFDELKTSYSEYVPDRFYEVTGWEGQFLGYTDLRLSVDQLREFSQAILEFWRSVPENIFSSEQFEVPRWFENAFNKDRDDS
ncbi:hypothetical protein QWI17_03605 [Gilvimarinus sp. SDUM040013]|uniref:Uncharacterized protein n=1 Tax=Gilvimarinus gilvus TaxID=3058038 RepID=A0ABU4S290_9GAMM|nr:hypothetical protein [Gilvimarinus sp. SDUM040013]MDO3384923.1 hypothetical protein [Gilvimarinus sp. SDUM040013]MDX6851292.1 hypothetical protein [Gilvimarinus sp. SDUM040013]